MPVENPINPWIPGRAAACSPGTKHPASALITRSLALGIAGALAGACYWPDPDGTLPPVQPAQPVQTATFAPPPIIAGVSCDEKLAPPTASLRRLTTSQMRNTLRDLVGGVVGDSKQANAVLDSIRAYQNFPEDGHPTEIDHEGAFRRLDQAIQLNRVQANYQIGVELGHALTKPTYLEKSVGACATDSNTANDATCIETFIRTFGRKALRRPMTDADVTFFRGVYGSSTAQDPDAYADVIGVMLNAPDFVALVESGSSTVGTDPNALKLGPYELASRLSYHLWDTMPDDALFAAAADESILTEDGFKKQVERMFADSRARSAMSNFFSDWLKLQRVPALDATNSDPTFKTFAGPNLPSAMLRDQVVQDALDTMDQVTFPKNGNLHELFTTQDSYAKGAELATIYGLAAWDGKSAPASFQGARPGILTRAAFLMTGSATTRPIPKGAFVRRSVLCDEVPPPPADVKQVVPDLSPNRTTREVVEELTGQAGTSCTGCHTNLINPIGFAFEGFDALGRPRTEQTLYNKDGSILGKKPIRTDTIPALDGRDTTVSKGPSDLIAMLEKSPALPMCFTRKFYQYAHERYDTPSDGCSIIKLNKALEKGSLTDMFRATVMDPKFRQRVFDGPKQ
jgi:Protein of unknown function (DUF1592)/Protein of unknown function (DUF1588)/Protein of unknown function (DUF1595)/Protein of unknown function (DUF1585)